MPSLKDFTEKAGKTPAAGVSVNKVLKAQQEGQDETNEKLTDIAGMFVNAQEKASAEASKYDAKSMKALISIDKSFESYFNNLSDMNVMLNKFVDPNYKMNKKEANRLQAMLATDKQLVSGIDAMRSSDAQFNASMEKLQSENNFIFRNKGLMDDEERRLAKKNNESIKDLWGSINDNIEVLSTDVMSDLKTSLIEGIGGPYASMMRKVLVPMFKQIKDSKLGQIVGDKFKNLGGFLRKSYKRQETVDKELSNGETESIVDGLDNVVEEQEVEKKKQNQKGVFKRLLDEQIKTNEGLSAFADSLHSEITALNDAISVIASGDLVARDLGGKSKEEVNGIFSTSDSKENYFDNMLTTQNIAREKETLANNLFEQFMESRSAADEGTLEHRDAQGEFQILLMEKLQDIEDAIRRVEGDGGGMLGDAIGLGIASRIGPMITGALVALSRFFLPIAVGLAAFKLFTSGEQADISKLAEVDLIDEALDLARRGGTPELVKQIEELGKIEDEQERSVAIRKALGAAGMPELVSKAYGEDVGGRRVIDLQKLAGEGGMPLTTRELKKVVSSGIADIRVGEDIIEAGTSGKALKKSFRDLNIGQVLDARNKAILTGVLTKDMEAAFAESGIDALVDETMKEKEKADIALAAREVKKEDRRKATQASLGINQGALKGGDQRKKLDEVGIHGSADGFLYSMNSAGLSLDRGN